MGNAGVQMACVALGVLGLIGVIVSCTVPRWKVSYFIGSNIVTVQSVQDGLWMSCAVQSTGQQQCKSYNSVLILASDLQAARAMVIISIMLCCLSLLVLFCGAEFTTCIQNEDAKPKISLVAGVGLMLAGLLVIIPVSWSANIVVQNFNNPFVVDKKELGECIYVGWGAGVLLLLAGGLLCCFSRPKQGSSGGTARFTNSTGGTNKAFV
ncbi:claudin-9-like [Anabas testudineus]|uniref:Claudin n=1 Tax=Anabas testudineus TaxID=64144 RepID=A0A7N6B941_ANATE|nr:claudin-9-like [Anabas testudineus]